MILETHKCYNTTGLGMSAFASLELSLLLQNATLSNKLSEWALNISINPDLILSIKDIAEHVIGSYLGAYVITDNKQYITKAQSWAQIILKTMNETIIPYPLINPLTSKAEYHPWVKGVDISEVSAIFPPLLSLSAITGMTNIYKKTSNFLSLIESKIHNKMLPLLLDTKGQLIDDKAFFPMNPTSSSYFWANLLRIHLLTANKTDPFYPKLISFFDAQIKNLKSKRIPFRINKRIRI